MKTLGVFTLGILAILPCLVLGEDAPDLARERTEDRFLATLPETISRAAEQYSRMLVSLKGDPKMPRTFVDGKVETVKPQDWTSGFFPGSLWYLSELTGDHKWTRPADDYTTRLESLKSFTGHHDVGFMLYCSYGNGYRLTRKPAYRKVLLEGAESLASRYDPKVGLIRSWSHGNWKYPVIIDNMMNLELLTWAAREGGPRRLQDIAVSHADRTMKNHYREDASSYHLVDYDPETGGVLGKMTFQGFADGSIWARGQAWGLYGYTMMARETGNAAYQEHALRIADFIMKHPRLPEDKVPYWDFDAPDIPNAKRDASAAAVIASAMIELAGRVKGERGREMFDFARQQLLALSSPAYLAKPGENGNFILMHSVGFLPRDSEVDVPLNYADYYFLEALLRYRKLMTGK
jgi:hypothetical protein